MRPPRSAITAPDTLLILDQFDDRVDTGWYAIIFLIILLVFILVCLDIDKYASVRINIVATGSLSGRLRWHW